MIMTLFLSVIIDSNSNLNYVMHYSQLSNKRGGSNKGGGGNISEKLING